VGFLNVIDNWIDQVGVVPAWRGRRVGAHLVAIALRSLAADGAREAWLCVNDDNPAAALYRRLGFHDAGRRARYLHRRA
ncbi:GNAT family N-acetyltransferase, partial [Polymorphospora sp. NPDC051019]|uniref:GNAT family N-acetyltransferase n=1 Tax=Polymorphospora sp. NPDC051019 TaxID=3155725 RepID=UPI00342612DE